MAVHVNFAICLDEIKFVNIFFTYLCANLVTIEKSKNAQGGEKCVGPLGSPAQMFGQPI
jgi:hypothetical protein